MASGSLDYPQTGRHRIGLSFALSAQITDAASAQLRPVDRTTLCTIQGILLPADLRQPKLPPQCQNCFELLRQLY